MKLKETAACYMGSWPLRPARSTSSSRAVCYSRRSFVARRDFPNAMKSFKPFLGKAEKKAAEILKTLSCLLTDTPTVSVRCAKTC